MRKRSVYGVGGGPVSTLTLSGSHARSTFVAFERGTRMTCNSRMVPPAREQYALARVQKRLSNLRLDLVPLSPRTDYATAGDASDRRAGPLQLVHATNVPREEKIGFC